MRYARLALLALIAGCAPAATVAAPEAFKMSLPLACEFGKTCEIQNYLDEDPGPGVKDYRCGGRTYDKHNGVDFRILDMAAQRRGVAVLAVAPGKVTGVRDGMDDISIRAPNAPPLGNRQCGNGVAIDHGNGWVTQSCHVAKGSLKVKPGDIVKAGQPIARVGLSGDTEFPHVHVTVWKNGKVIDPFAPDLGMAGSCKSQPGLWDAAATRALAYKAGAILNTGFASDRVSGDAIENGAIPAPTAQAPYLVAYTRVIGLKTGDRLQLTLKAPSGAILVEDTLPPFDRDKAVYSAFIGKKKPASGWPSGAYAAQVRILRGGGVAAERSFSIRL